MWVRGFECARVMRSLVCVHCFVWSVVFGSQHSCLEFWFRVEVRTLALHVLSLCGSVRSRIRSAARSSVHVCFVVLHAVPVFLGCVHSCYILCCVARSLCISLAACFHVVMSCVNTWLMSFLISCVFMSCFAHGWWFVCWPCACVFVLCEHVASVLVSCVPCALMSICLDLTHLVTCLLINFLSLVTLLIFSLCNLLIGSLSFVVCLVSCPALPCPALFSLFQPVSLPVCFSLTGLFLFVLFCIINKKSVSTCTWQKLHKTYLVTNVTSVRYKMSTASKTLRGNKFFSDTEAFSEKTQYNCMAIGLCSDCK